VSDSSDKIDEFTPGGVESTFASGFSQLGGGLVFNSAGNLFVYGNWDYILEFTPDGVRSTFASGLANVYNGMVFDSAGNLFVLEYGNGMGNNGNILEFTPGGGESTFASGLYAPTALAFQPEPVPEPSVLALLAVGTGALCIHRRHKGKSFT